MAPDNATIVRLWLETNFAEASAKGTSAIKAMRDLVVAMGPEMAAAFDKIAGAEEKAAETTATVVQAQGKLKQGTLDFTEVLQLQGVKEREISTLSQEVLRRMRERQDAQLGVNRAIEMANEDMRAQAAEEDRLAGNVARNQLSMGRSYSTLRAEVQQLEMQLKGLRTAFKAGEIDSAQFASASAGLTTQLQAKTSVLAKTNAATASYGRGLLQTSYAVQDFTSQLGTRGLVGALGAVQNNIPVILTGLGVGAGLAGVISIVSVGLGMALPLLDSFSEGQTKAAEATKHHAEEADKLKNALTSEQETIKHAVDTYTKDANNKVVGQAIESALFQESKDKEVSEKDLSAAMAGLSVLPGETITEQLERGRVAARQKSAHEDANRLFSTLSTDPSSRAEAARLAESHGGFPKGFAGAMRSPLTATPEAQFKQGEEELDEIFAQNAESDKKKKDAKKEAEERVSADNLAKKFAKEKDAADAKAAQQEKEELVAADNLATKFTREADQENARAKAKEVKDAEQAAKHAEQAATRAAHDADPRRANRRAIQEEQSHALGLVQQNTRGFTADVQKHIAHHLQGNHEAGEDLAATFQQALAYAIQQTRQDIARGIHTELQRHQQNSQSFYGP